MRIFWKKILKIVSSVEDSAPEPSFSSGGWRIRPRPPLCYSSPLLQLCRVPF